MVHAVHMSASSVQGVTVTIDGRPATQVLACIAPGPDEIVLAKTSSNVFASTNIDYILRSLGVKYGLYTTSLCRYCTLKSKWIATVEAVLFKMAQ